MTASPVTAVQPLADKEQWLPRLRQTDIQLIGMTAGGFALFGLHVWWGLARFFLEPVPIL
jgi:hypothetical protein